MRDNRLIDPAGAAQQLLLQANAFMQLPFCTGPFHRREFMRVGMLALGGVTLPELMACRVNGWQRNSAHTDEDSS